MYHPCLLGTKLSKTQEANKLEEQVESLGDDILDSITWPGCELGLAATCNSPKSKMECRLGVSASEQRLGLHSFISLVHICWATSLVIRLDDIMFTRLKRKVISNASLVPVATATRWLLYV